MRFAAVQDPCDHWLVCDLQSGLPAEQENRPLIGLTRCEADQLAARANAEFLRRAPVPLAIVA